MGSRLQGGRFGVGKVLWQGRFGFTYLGSEVGTRRAVAIKEFFPQGSTRAGTEVVPPGGWPDYVFAEEKRHFLQEGRALRWFKHPGVVHLVEYFEENRTAYVVLEHLKGDTLLTQLRERTLLPEEEAVRHVRAVGEALLEVHRGGFLHLDVKPQNILITPEGRAVLIDFGAAREFGAESSPRSRMLTEGYAPPEQYGERVPVNTSTEVYALAATLYHLLTGRVPLAAPDRAKIALAPVRQWNPQVSEDVEQAVMQGLELEIARRPPTVQDFLDLLPGGPELVRVPAPRSASTSASSRQGVALQGHTSWVSCVAFSPREMLLASGSWDEVVRLWNVMECVEVGSLEGHVSWLGGIAFSPDGTLLASAGDDRSVRLWDVAQRREVTRLEGHRSSVVSVAFSPDGRTIASGSWDRSVRLWEVASGQSLVRLDTPGGMIASVAFSPDGAFLAAGSMDRLIRVWHVASGREAMRLEGHGGPVRNIAFSPDGSILASTSDDSTVRLWALPTVLDASGQLTQRAQLSEALLLEGHSGTVWTVAFNPRVQLLATGGEDRTVRLWNVASQQEFLRLEGHDGPVWSLAFSPDGALLASGSWDRSVRLWAMDRLQGRKAE